MTSKKRVISADVRSLLRTRFASPEWALFWEVSNGTGMNARRFADAVAMNMWPSRGLTIHGIEIKVSKTDFKKEISQPEKSEAVQRYCDYWWIAAPKEAVDVSLLPDAWGWLEVQGERLVARKDAPKLESVPFDRTFAAALLRRAGEQQERDFKAEVDKRISARQSQLEQDFEKRVEQRTRELRTDSEKLDKILSACGEGRGKYDRFFDDERFCEAVRVVLNCRLVGNYSPLLSAHGSLKQALSHLDKALDSVKATQSELPVEDAHVNQVLKRAIG